MKYEGVRRRVSPWRRPAGRLGTCQVPEHRTVLLLHRGQRHKSESIDFPPCREAGNCHVESADLGTRNQDNYSPRPPTAQRAERMQDTEVTNN